jgi:hypothetical protein
VDSDEAAQLAGNAVRYSIDGEDVPVAEGLSIAFIDTTKNLLGPNTEIYFECSVLISTGKTSFSDKLRMNIPSELKPGRYAVHYSPLPGKNQPWVQYRESATENWVAYDGEVSIDQIGGIGSRLRVSFETLHLANSCGQTRTIEHGVVDVVIGSEDSFPVSEIEMGEGSEWAELHVAESNENNTVLELDGHVYACDGTDLYLTTEKLGPALNVGVSCVCGFDAERNSARSMIHVGATLPISAPGIIDVTGSDYGIYLWVDAQNPTVDDPTDDLLWISRDSPQLRYIDIASQVREPLDIELTRSLRLQFADLNSDTPTVDPSNTRTLSSLHVYGFLNE